MTADAREAEAFAAEHTAHMPEGPERDLTRLALEVGYLRGAIQTRTIELQVARERLAAMEAAERKLAVPS